MSSVVLDMTAGRLVRTNRSLDLAIEGQGFFHVAHPLKKRDAYTRRGRFTTNIAGQLVLRAGDDEWILNPEITIPAGTAEIEVAADGQVRGCDAASHVFRSFGSIWTACFPSADALVAIEGTFFVPAHAHRALFGISRRSGHGLLHQGYLEESNVDVKQELEEFARLAEHAQALEQAARLIHLRGPDRPEGAGDASAAAPNAAFPAGREGQR